MIQLEFHHTGILVNSIENSLAHYSRIFGAESISEVYSVSSQKVKVCFVKNGKRSFLELVEPLSEDSVVTKMLKKRISYYHVGYKVKNVQNAIKVLEEENYKALSIFNSEAFQGKPCVFLFTPEGHLVELIEE